MVLNFIDGSAPYLSAANLNSIVADTQNALGVVDAALATRVNDVSGLGRAALNATYAPGSTPAIITGGPFKGGFDRRNSVYNLKPSHLRRTRAALGKARAGTGQAKVLMIGDSTTGGVGAGTIGVNDWPSTFASMLSSAGYPLAGSGFVAAQKASAKDSRWVYSNTDWVSLSGYDNLIMGSGASVTATFTSLNAATTVNVYYANTGGAFTVAIDGGAAVAVTPVGGSTMGTYSVTGLANTTHSVVIVRTSGTAQIFGAEVGVGNGVRILNGGIGGEKILSSPGWYTTDAIGTAPGGFNADLTFLMMETNDTGVTAAATYKTNVQGVITTIKNNGADLVLVTAVPSSGKDFTAYNQALYELADTNDIPLIDLQDRMGTYTLTNGYGLMLDGLHPNSAGYAEVARAIFGALAL